MTALRRCALGLAAALACTPEPFEVYEGEYVTLKSDPALVGCGDMVGHMDRFVARTAEFLGVELDGRDFTFYWFTEEGYDTTSKCPESTLGCASGTKAGSQAAPHDHELVHLIMRRIGTAPSFFNEGAAVAFELEASSPNGDDAMPGSGDVLALLASETRLGIDHYPLAGAFTRFLIDRHGLAAYRKFYASLARADLLPQIEEAHAAGFGESLEQTLDAFDAAGRTCTQDRFRLKLFECSAPQIEWDGDSLLLRRSLTCGDADVVGPFADSSARVFSSVEVATAGLFEVSLASDDSWAVASLGSCGGCEDERTVLIEDSRDPVQMWLPAGRYYLTLASDVQAATTVALRLERVDGP